MLTPGRLLLRKGRLGHSILMGRIWAVSFIVTAVAFASAALAQSVTPLERVESQVATVVASQATVPLSECPSLWREPIASAWCSLTQASPVLQSIQILLLGTIGFVAVVNAVRVRKRRKEKLVTVGITKHSINVEPARLTSITNNSGTGWFVAGFSGNLWKIDKALKVTAPSSESVGLVRSLALVWGRNSVVIGGDDGIINVFDTKTSALSRLATFGSPIYRLACVSDRLFVAALGSGDVVALEIQQSPGQSDFSFREHWRVKAHNGAAFDIVATGTAFVSVGADGRLVEIDYSGSITSECKVSDATIWSITQIDAAAYVVGCNDGALARIESGKVVTKRKIHQSAARQVLTSPKSKWCVSLGKDRSVFATLADLSASVLLHRTKDYLYDGSVSDDGMSIVVCDGAGDVTLLQLDLPLDSYDHSTLAARV